MSTICPASNLIVQGWGCCSNAQEFPASWCYGCGGYYHAGIDLGYTGGGQAIFRAPVYAARDWICVAVGADGSSDFGFAKYLGDQAVCLHFPEDDVYALHGHLDQAMVVVGQTGRAGQPIGLVGTKGSSTAPHLHLEVRTDGPYQNVWRMAANVLDPTPYLIVKPKPLPPPPPKPRIAAAQENAMFSTFTDVDMKPLQGAPAGTSGFDSPGWYVGPVLAPDPYHLRADVEVVTRFGGHLHLYASTPDDLSPFWDKGFELAAMKGTSIPLDDLEGKHFTLTVTWDGAEIDGVIRQTPL